MLWGSHYLGVPHSIIRQLVHPNFFLPFSPQAVDKAKQLKAQVASLEGQLAEAAKSKEELGRWAAVPLSLLDRTGGRSLDSQTV